MVKTEADSLQAVQDDVKLQMKKVIKEKVEIHNLKKQVRDLEAKCKDMDNHLPNSPSLKGREIELKGITKDIHKGYSLFDKLLSKNVPHILENIFLSLDYGSYKICLEVNASWNELLSSESYQSKGKSVFGPRIKHDQIRLIQDSRCGKAAEVRRLLSTGMLDVNKTLTFAEMDGPPLLEASRSGHTDVVKMLLVKGAKPDQLNHFGRTPLHWASSNNYPDVVQLLVDRGADPNLATPADNYTPLYFAAIWDCKDVVQILLDKGADPNVARSDDGTTPLNKAAEFGYKDVAQLLLDRGADPNKADIKGENPLSKALEGGHYDIANILKAGGALT